MPNLAKTALLRELHREIAELVANRVKPHMPSRFLKKTTVTTATSKSGHVIVPPYWALYIHEGRGGFGPVRAKVLCYFEDPADDPRLRPEPPIRLKDVKRLTRDQFYAALEINRQHAELGLPPFMHVRRHVGPTPGVPFFTLGTINILDEVAPIVNDRFDSWVRAQVVSQKSVAIGRL